MNPNVLVCGRTGAGKTTLIRAVSTPGTVPDDAVGENAAPCTKGFVMYPDSTVNFIDAEGMESGVSVSAYLDFLNRELCRRLFSDTEAQLIHCIWYCIDGSSARVQQADADLIRALPPCSLLVVTKCELIRRSQMDGFNAALNALMEADRVVTVSSVSADGLPVLMERTNRLSAQAVAQGRRELEAFQARWEAFYHSRSLLWRERNDYAAGQLIRSAARRALLIALIPLPLIDLAPLMANEAYMISAIAAIYGYGFNTGRRLGFLAALETSGAVKLAITFFPLIKAPVAAALTYAAGRAAGTYFASGAVLSRAEMRSHFEQSELDARRGL